MNWLVISPNIRDEKLKIIEDFLFSHDKITPHEIFLTDPMDRETLCDSMRHSLQSTHCIILDCDKMVNLPDFVFLLGMLAGKRVETFIQGQKTKIGRFSYLDSDCQGLFKCYEDFDSLMSMVEKKFPEMEKHDFEHNALIQLFTMGVPFTADSFAHYLEKDVEDVYKLFIHAGMIVNAKTSDNVPMLCISARSEHLDQVEWLLSLGANIDEVSGDRGYSAVMDAVWRKNYKIAKFLIEKGADLSIVSTDGQPILVLAVGNGDAKIVELLLENNADPDLKDSMGMSARQYATLFKKKEIIALMEKYPPKN